MHERRECTVRCSVERYSKTTLFGLFSRLCISGIEIFHLSFNFSFSRCQVIIIFTLNIFKKIRVKGE